LYSNINWFKIFDTYPVISELSFSEAPGPNFIIKDLTSVLILIIADQILNESLCCSNKYN